MTILEQIEQENLKSNVPSFDVGDTVRVYVKVVEGDKERIQVYEGLVTARKNGSIRETFTVRRISFGVGVERTFPLHSPRIDRVEVIHKGKVRRAKLYYMRKLTGKATRLQQEDAMTDKSGETLGTADASTDVVADKVAESADAKKVADNKDAK
jgi:large subunit ribosomal protein L19